MLTRIAFSACFILFATATSCTLSARQEEHVTEQLNNYIAAHNDGRLLEVIGLTHPSVVKYYKAQGDTLFINHFKDINNDKKTYYGNALYREMKEKGKQLQRRYTVQYYTGEVELNHEYNLFALSDDGGDNWFFIRADDYRDRNIKGFDRLFN